MNETASVIHTKLNKDGELVIESIEEIEILDCGYECHYSERYGFVPESGCPVHDYTISPNLF